MDSRLTCPQEKPLSTSLTKQLLIYLLSVSLSPLGLWPAVRYLRQKDEKAKKIGLVAIFLTVISIVLTIWLTARFIGSLGQNFGSQLNMFEDLDY